jgi:hypothetical protein
MSHFYGTMEGSRGKATRCGTKNSGMTVTAASWRGAVRTTLFVDSKGRDCFRVEEITWKGAGRYRILTEGFIGCDAEPGE